MSEVTIVTRLHPAVQQGAVHVERVHKRFAATPRGLLAAVRGLPEHRRWMVVCYGNDGAGLSWIEVNAVRVHDFDIETVYTETQPLVAAAALLKRHGVKW